MNAYFPHDGSTAWLTGLILAGVLALSFLITRVRGVRLARTLAWALVVSATAGVERLCAAEPAGFRMLAIIGALLWSMKAVVSVESQADGHPRLAPLAWLGFAAGWFGMRPAPFAAAGGPPLPRAGELFWSGVKRLALGLVLLLAARLVWQQSLSQMPSAGGRWLATALALPGLSLILHFGIFNIVAGAWRRAGVDCRPLFRAPLLARNLSEFWGRRWNLAFSEMTALGVYRPLSRVVGTRTATLLAFACSGLLHELAISVPVQAGYGLPSLYFLLHGTLVLIEKRLERGGRPIERLGWAARLWVLGWLALPLPILFHPPFLEGVVWPLLGPNEFPAASARPG